MKVRLALATTAALAALGATAPIATADAGPATDPPPTFFCINPPFLTFFATAGEQLGDAHQFGAKCTRIT
jgi:hypothetical protein